MDVGGGVLLADGSQCRSLTGLDEALPPVPEGYSHQWTIQVSRLWRSASTQVCRETETAKGANAWR